MERPRQNQLESINFDELFGDISSYREVQAATRKVKKFFEEAVYGLHLNNFEKSTEISFDDIGKIFGVSQERIRQRVAIGLRILKHPSRASKFVKTGYVKKIEEEQKGWHGDTIKSTRYSLDES